MGKGGYHLTAIQYSTTPLPHDRKLTKLSPPLLRAATGENGLTITNH